jgi:hypothetical protein
MARRRADSAGCSQDVLNGGMWLIEQLADLVQGIALAPAIRHHRLLCFGVVDPKSLLHGLHSLRQVQSLCCIDRLIHSPKPPLEELEVEHLKPTIMECGKPKLWIKPFA